MFFFSFWFKLLKIKILSFVDIFCLFVVFKFLISSISQEETDKLREQEREIESRNLAEADLAVMKEKLRMEHDHTIGLIQQAVYMYS